MTIATPKAHLIARTTICEPITQFMDINPDASEVETLIEFAGRACYQSFHRPVEATNTTEKYTANTLFNRGHWSIAEHASATFYITGVSRAFTHELIRHRHLSFSQLSQRFVDESKPGVVIPPSTQGLQSGTCRPKRRGTNRRRRIAMDFREVCVELPNSHRCTHRRRIVT